MAFDHFLLQRTRVTLSNKPSSRSSLITFPDLREVPFESNNFLQVVVYKDAYVCMGI